MTDNLLCTEDRAGNVVWIATRRETLEAYTKQLRRAGERYRIVARDVKINRSKVTLFTMTINPKPGKER